MNTPESSTNSSSENQPRPFEKSENVGAEFVLDDLLHARTLGWKLLYDIRKQIVPGMTEADANAIYQSLLEMSGAEKQWHPPKIRFGVNTLRSFREPSVPDVRLSESDLFFIDIGPIYNGYEADVGETFVIGDNPIHLRVNKACKGIFSQIRALFLDQSMSGPELYARAEELALAYGYQLVGEGAQGHRIGDFPHAIHYRGSLRHYAQAPRQNRWILEIQLRDPVHEVGAFFEDLV